jgi:hypothetical protein
VVFLGVVFTGGITWSSTTAAGFCSFLGVAGGTVLRLFLVRVTPNDPMIIFPRLVFLSPFPIDCNIECCDFKQTAKVGKMKQQKDIKFTRHF